MKKVTDLTLTELNHWVAKTSIIAAMRCYVASDYGDTVDD